MGRSLRVGSSAVVLVISAIVVANGVAAATQASTLSPKLVGAWNRNVTEANWHKYGQTGPIGVWTMVVWKDGAVYFYTPGSYKPGCIAKSTCGSDFSTRFAVRGARLTVDTVPVCATKGTYGWRVAGSLTLDAVADKACGAREALFTGVWKRTRL